MKIDFGKALKDFKTGEPLKDPEGSIISLGFICVEALMAEIPEKMRTGRQKLEAYELAQQIHSEVVIDVTSTQAANLKERVGEMYGPVIVGQCWPLLDASE